MTATMEQAISAAISADTDKDVKVLVVGDTHGDFGFMERDVIPHAVDNDCRTIVQVGDFGFVWDDDIRIVTEKLLRLSVMLSKENLELHFLLGNHENFDMIDYLCRRSSARSSEGHHKLAPRVFCAGRLARWSWEGVSIAAVSGAVSIDRAFRTEGKSWWQAETLTPAEVEAAKHLGTVDLLLSHDAPINIPMGDLVPHLASQANRAQMTDIAAALQPAMWVHGHYHQSLHYRWTHGRGNCAVRGLDCNGAPRQDSMLVVNLTALRKSLSLVHYGGQHS